MTRERTVVRKLISLHPADNVLIAAECIYPGDVEIIDGKTITFTQRVEVGHKVAASFIECRRKIYKFGMPIGSATTDIRPGAHVHRHNVRSDFLPTRKREEDEFSV